MAPETGIVLAMAAAFLLLGIALSPLAWVALSQRRTRSERETAQCFLELHEQVRALRDRLQCSENALAALERPDGRGTGARDEGAEKHHPRGPHRLGRRPQPPRVRPGPPDFAGLPNDRDSRPNASNALFRGEGSATERRDEEDSPNLISVPNLADAPDERQAALDGLAERHAAIWNLRDAGASAEMIARATGQPIGQIELILGLRRQIDGVRTTRPHAGHPHE